jgi:KipI family sensor histidine kinase inhibitor
MLAMSSPNLPRASQLGASALLFEACEALGDAAQERVWTVAEEARAWVGVRETVPGMNNLMILFDPLVAPSQDLIERVNQAWLAPARGARAGKTVEVQVVYGGEFGPDLAEVAMHAGLDVKTVVKLHSQRLYTVYCLGAHPGFAYLAGLDPKLHTPRRAEPRVKVPAGSVGIGGAQTGAIAQSSPSGWQLIGKTEQTFFDAAKSPPALLVPGDRVQFRAVRIVS